MPYKLDFKQIAEEIDIYAVAKLLNINVIKDRAKCARCDSDRALQFFPDTNSFQCHAAGETRNSDCIALYAHIQGTGMYQAAKALSEHFQTATAAGRSTPPTRPEGRTAQAQPAPKPFDPQAFADKLGYTSEVGALGLSEADAARLLIGWHPQRKAVYSGLRNPDGSISGFIKFAEGQLTMPPKWIDSKVVLLRRA
jgi:hypothetical protein